MKKLGKKLQVTSHTLEAYLCSCYCQSCTSACNSGPPYVYPENGFHNTAQSGGFQ